MKKNINSLLTLFMLVMLTACQSLPQLFSSTEQVLDDNAIKLEVSREAIQKDTDIDVSIKVTNKDAPNATKAG